MTTAPFNVITLAGTRAERHMRLLRAFLGCILSLGLLLAAVPVIWVPVRNATLVDVTLTPAELRDPVKVDIVRRSLRYQSSIAQGRMWICGVAGGAVSGLALAALVVVGRIAASPDATEPVIP